MRAKSLSDIHITEIIRDAGVARVSFYRNYASKEDVLVTLIRDVLEDFRTHLCHEQDCFYTYENVLPVLLEELNHFHEEIAGNMPASSIQKYELYLYIGALFNTAVMWLPEESRCSAETMAAYFFDTISKALNR